MNITTLTIIGLASLVGSWLISTFIFWKCFSNLKGKIWIIGIVGGIFQVALYWILAIYTSYLVLMIVGVIIFPTWLNYLYFLGKYKRKRKEFLDEKSEKR